MARHAEVLRSARVAGADTKVSSTAWAYPWLPAPSTKSGGDRKRVRRPRAHAVTVPVLLLPCC